MNFTIHHRSPSVEEYNQLRALAGWPVLEPHLVAAGLENSLFAVSVFHAENYIIGMGRIVGDNAIYLHIQDVIVHPEFQRQQIGKLIMDELMAYTQRVGGKNTNIGLMCSKGREDFYKAFGFTARPTEKFGAGMTKIK
jgi:ribosomal protein S18 acetylase RimI-like enzyme